MPPVRPILPSTPPCLTKDAPSSTVMRRTALHLLESRCASRQAKVIRSLHMSDAFPFSQKQRMPPVHSLATCGNIPSKLFLGVTRLPGYPKFIGTSNPQMYPLVSGYPRLLLRLELPTYGSIPDPATSKAILVSQSPPRVECPLWYWTSPGCRLFRSYGHISHMQVSATSRKSRAKRFRHGDWALFPVLT